MKKILSSQHLTAVCFLLILGTMLLGSIRPCLQIAFHQLEKLRTGQGVYASSIEQEYNEAMPFRSALITLNGGFQRLMGVRCVNDRYRLDNGHLTAVIPQIEVAPLAEKTAAFRDALAQLGIPFGYVNTLYKIDPEDKQLPRSIEDYSNENADRFLALLEQQDIPVLDLRQREKAQGLDHYSLYYVTDHHWTAETGFWAYTQLVQWLTELDSSFAVDPALTDAGQYAHIVYRDSFLGSCGRRTGPLYAGLDDLTVILPKFDTRLHSLQPVIGDYREGTYSQTLLYYDYLNRENLMETSAYSVYLGADQPQLLLYNDSRQWQLPIRSTPKRLLILKDSTALVVAPFLALSYDELCLIDLRSFEGDLMQTIRDYRPDMVLTVYNPGALEAHNYLHFEFLP